MARYNGREIEEIVASYDEFVNAILMGAPDSWDDDAGAESIAIAYVREMELRLDAAGISREKWARNVPEEPSMDTDRELYPREGL